MPKSLKITLPILIEADDYHEFSQIKKTFNQIIKDTDNPKKEAVSFEEIGFFGGYYNAVFFPTSKPFNKENIEGHYAEFLKTLPKSVLEEILEFAEETQKSANKKPKKK